MSPDIWEEIQAIKQKFESYRKRLEHRKRKRFDILATSSLIITDLSISKKKKINDELNLQNINAKIDPRIEHITVKVLSDISSTLPISSMELFQLISTSISTINYDISHDDICNILQKLATQNILRLKKVNKSHEKLALKIIFAENVNLLAIVNEYNNSNLNKNNNDIEIFEEITQSSSNSKSDVIDSKSIDDDTNSKKNDELLTLLTMPTTKEKASKKIGEEILNLLNKPTAKEKSLAERFQSQGGAQVTQFCDDGTRKECRKNRPNCTKLHFKKIIQKHTDETLGDCSFLNTCFHMDTCKYVHYEVEKIDTLNSTSTNNQTKVSLPKDASKKDLSIPAQWIQCDLRYLDMSILGKFAVIMADPPWDIHMELPYGTMSDDEMRQLDIPVLQDKGLIFLWVTGRAMELGRECLKLWGYDRIDELIWVKTNQLQRIIRTGRTGHWLNHGKEHCLVGMKGNLKGLNRGIDCDVIVAEVRATSHKPDEIYGIIERLSPGTRKIELFGRMHNIQPNWLTLGNQVDGVQIVDQDLIEAFRKRYPSGNCMINDSNKISRIV